jgi:hypothetical protein
MSRCNKNFFNLSVFWSASNDVNHDKHSAFVNIVIKLLKELNHSYLFCLKNAETSNCNKSFFNLSLFWSASNDVYHNKHSAFVNIVIKLLKELHHSFPFSLKNVEMSNCNKNCFNLCLFWSTSNDICNNEHLKLHTRFVCDKINY